MSNKMPDGYRFTNVAQYHDTDDCMGRRQTYWSMDIATPDGRILTANGDIPTEAADKVIALAVKDAAFRALPDMERLGRILAEANKRGRLYDRELLDALTIIASKLNRGENNMLDRVQNAFVRMGKAGLYARMNFGENAAAATPEVIGKAMRLAKEGQVYIGVALFSESDLAEYNKSGNLMIHFAPLPKDRMPSEELARLGKEVGFAVTCCLAQEGLQVEWSGQAEETILVTGLCTAVV